MDPVPCGWNAARVPESFARNKNPSDTLTKLAKLVAQKQERHGPSHSLPDVPPCGGTECGQEFSDRVDLLHHRQGQHALRRPHRCLSCGQEFSLMSSLQLHKCVREAAPCQLCLGNPQLGNACPAGMAPDSEGVPDKPLYHQNHHHASLSYACAPCGKGFSQKQALLHHQQAECSESASRTAKEADAPSPDSALSDSSPPDSPPSDSPPSCSPTRHGLQTQQSLDRPIQCPLCLKSFRSGAGLACHQRFSHLKEWTASRYLPPKSANGCGPSQANGRGRKAKGQLLSCRTCDMVFPSTAKLYRHRQESHSREGATKRAPRQSIGMRRKRETYPCSVCGKVFLHHLSLRAHAKKHGQEPPCHVHPGGKAAKEPKSSERTPKRPKSSPAQETGGPVARAGRGRWKAAPTGEEEDGEYPCPSCAEVFSLQSALMVHEELHQPRGPVRHCSVCSQCMGMSKKPGAKVRKAYHCVPCLKAFGTLDTFLQHCQVHVVVSDDEEGSRPGLGDANSQK